MQEKPPPTWADVAYGPHARNTYDIWKAAGDHTPVFVFIHGGGWTNSDKSILAPRMLADYLAAGISVAAVNYRYTTIAPLPAPIQDAARAIQHMRHHAADYGIDPVRMSAWGGSAGACTSLNLALGPDFADLQSDDPVARQSSRPLCAGGSNGQTAIDPELLRDWLGDAILEHRMPNLAVDEADAQGMLRNYAKHRDMLRRFSPYYHVDPATAVPVFLEYTPRGGRALTLPACDGGVAIHHCEMGMRLKARMDAMQLECHLYISPQVNDTYSGSFEFFRGKLLPS